MGRYAPGRIPSAEEKVQKERLTSSWVPVSPASKDAGGRAPMPSAQVPRQVPGGVVQSSSTVSLGQTQAAPPDKGSESDLKPNISAAKKWQSHSPHGAASPTPAFTLGQTPAAPPDKGSESEKRSVSETDLKPSIKSQAHSPDSAASSSPPVAAQSDDVSVTRLP